LIASLFGPNPGFCFIAQSLLIMPALTGESGAHWSRRRVTT
jgi:hypothetical protein